MPSGIFAMRLIRDLFPEGRVCVCGYISRAPVAVTFFTAKPAGSGAHAPLATSISICLLMLGFKDEIHDPQKDAG